MSADLILADFKSKTWVSDRDRASKKAELQRLGLEIITTALMGEPGMCGMEPVIYVEIPHYHAPEKDPA